MLPKELQPYSIIIILLITMGFFIWRKIRYDIVALSALAVAIIIDAVPYDQVFIGLTNPAVITVASIMIISNVITRSNILNIFIHKLEKLTHSKLLHIFSFSFFIAILSAFMNNVGALSLLLPASISTSLKNNRSASYILMPIAMASALGGMTTLIGTPPNLIVSNFRAQAVGSPFKLFDFSYVGVATALFGILFIGLIGWRLLPTRGKKKDTYKQLYRSEIRIIPKSKWIGASFKKFKQNFHESIRIIGMIRRNKKYNLSMNTKINSGDRFIIESSLSNLEDLSHNKNLIISNLISTKSKLKTKNTFFLEAIVPINSKIVGKTPKIINFRSRYKCSIIAISQTLRTTVKRIRNIPLQLGDLVLMQCKDEKITEKLPMLGFIPIKETNLQLNINVKEFLPLLIFVLAILLPGLTNIPIEISLAGAALLMMILNYIPAREIYKSIDWTIIILLAAMIPLGDALNNSGGADLIANMLLSISHHLSVFFTIGLVMLITMFLSDFINNAATAIIMSPISINLAKSMGIGVDPLLMAVAIGASCAFLTPIGHQNNLLVMNPGKYRFFDYMRIGLPLEIIVLLSATPLIYWFWYRT